MISYNHKHWFVEKIVLQFVVVVIWTNETEISHIHRNPLVKSSAGDHKVALVPQFILNKLFLLLFNSVCQTQDHFQHSDEYLLVC